MRCPTLKDLPSPPLSKSGWPWTEQSKPLPDTTADGQLWPKISIVTPSYNQGGFIEEAIRSVLLQGYPDLEYIIIDGGSTDETIDVIKKYEPWLAHLVSEPDRGQSHAINKGLLKSTGRLFNWQNADDVFTPDCLAFLVEALIKNPHAGYVHGERIYVNKDRQATRSRNKHYDNNISFHPALEDAVSQLQAGSQPGCLIERDLILKAGMLDENLHYIMDVDILLRVALQKPPIHISKPLNFVRVYPGIKSLEWNPQRAKERIYLANKIFSIQILPDNIKKLKRQTMTTAHRFAWRCYIKAKIYSRFIWHFLLDIVYSPVSQWRGRLASLYRILRFGE
jgi:glycosyltransferase involved in cell wall biosynthesis